MATTSFTSRSVTYRSDGVTPDVVVDTVIDFNPPAGSTLTQDEFLAKCMPPRFRMFAEYFADLTEAERSAETGAFFSHPAMDAGTLDAIDYINEEIYQVFRGDGLTIAASGAVCSYTRIMGYVASGGGVHAGGSAGVLAIVFGATGAAAVTLSGTVVRVVDRSITVAVTAGAFAGAAADCAGAPKPVANIAAADGIGESVVGWDTQEGAVSYKIYYVIDYVAQTEAQIIAAPTGSVAGTVPVGQTVGSLTAGHIYAFTVTATNATTEGLGGTLNTATIT